MWAVIAVAVMCAVAGPPAAHAAGADSTITAIGFQTERFVANRAEVSIMVCARGKKNERLWKTLKEHVQMVLDVSDSIGGATTQVTVGPIEDWWRDGRNSRRLIGVKQTMTIEVNDLSRLIGLYTVLSRRRGVWFQRFTYHVENESLKRERLIRLATDDARQQAQSSIVELGQTLGDPVEVVVNPNQGEIYSTLYAHGNSQEFHEALRLRRDGPPGEELPSVQLSAAVRVRFAIR